MSVLGQAVAEHRPGADHLWFDVASIANDVSPAVAATIVRHIRQIGVKRILHGSDSAAPGNSPKESWAAFSRLPLTAAELQTIARNEAPYLEPAHETGKP